MDIYIAIFCLVILFSFIDLFNINHYIKWIFVLTYSLIMVFVSSIRWDQIQGDWQRYYQFFNENNKLSDFIERAWEPGYTLLVYTIKSFTNDYVIFMCIAATVVILTKVKGIMKLTPFPFLALLVSFSNQYGDIIVIRQTFSFAITLYSIQYIINQEKFKFLLCILIAISFHYSAFIFIFAYAIYNINFSKIKFIFLLINLSIFIVIVFQFDLLDKFLSLFPSEVSLVIKLIQYQEELETLSEYGISEGGIVRNVDYVKMFIGGVLRRAILLPLFYYLRFRIDESYRKIYDGLMKLYCIGVFIYVAFYNVSPSIANRGGYYYTETEILLIPAIVMISTNFYKRMLMFLLLMFYVSGKYIIPFYFDKGLEIPFRTIFS